MSADQLRSFRGQHLQTLYVRIDESTNFEIVAESVRHILSAKCVMFTYTHYRQHVNQDWTGAGVRDLFDRLGSLNRLERIVINFLIPPDHRGDGFPMRLLTVFLNASSSGELCRFHLANVILSGDENDITGLAEAIKQSSLQQVVWLNVSRTENAHALHSFQPVASALAMLPLTGFALRNKTDVLFDFGNVDCADFKQLYQSTTLQYLHFEGLKWNRNAIVSMAHGLGINRTLNNLKLEFHLTEVDKCLELVDVIRYNQSIEKLEMFFPRRWMDEDYQLAIVEALCANSCLKDVEFSAHDPLLSGIPLDVSIRVEEALKKMAKCNLSLEVMYWFDYVFPNIKMLLCFNRWGRKRVLMDGERLSRKDWVDVIVGASMDFGMSETLDDRCLDWFFYVLQLHPALCQSECVESLELQNSRVKRKRL